MQASLRVALCEDDAGEQAHLLDCVGQSGILAECTVFSNGEDFLAEFLPGLYDMVFLDIYLSGMPGIRVAQKIREKDEDVVIAFATSSPDHTLESYRLGALKYLEKPITVKDVKETLALALLKRQTASFITLLMGGKNKDIPLNTILFFEHRDHAVTVNTTMGVMRTSQTVKLSDVEAKLPSALFFRCHHSYIVNMRFVRELDKEFGVFTMKDDSKVYVKRQFLKKAAEVFEDYLFNAARRDED